MNFIYEFHLFGNNYFQSYNCSTIQIKATYLFTISSRAKVELLHCDNEPFLFPDTKYIQAVSGNCSPGLNIEMEKSEEVNEYKVLQDQLLARAYQQKLCITET